MQEKKTMLFKEINFKFSIISHPSNCLFLKKLIIIRVEYKSNASLGYCSSLWNILFILVFSSIFFYLCFHFIKFSGKNQLWNNMYIDIRYILWNKQKFLRTNVDKVKNWRKLESNIHSKFDSYSLKIHEHKIYIR